MLTGAKIGQCICRSAEGNTSVDQSARHIVERETSVCGEDCQVIVLSAPATTQEVMFPTFLPLLVRVLRFANSTVKCTCRYCSSKCNMEG